jgi:nucleoside phosphorylase
MADTSDRPSNREGFKIAIICAVQPEWEAVNLQLDVSYETEGISYGKLNNDQNAYTTGRFGGQHAVLVRMPGMGIAPAAACAASLRMSFPCVELVLLVGICGAAPYTADHRDILLGDVIIGSSVVPIGVGRLYPNGFKRKSSVEETVGRAPVEIRAFLGKVNYTLLEKKTAVHVAECYARDRRFPYPAAESDRLYRPDYQHMHQNPGSCSSCVKRESSAEEVCQDAASISCTELGCEDSQLLRDRGRRVDEPRVHVGPIASSDSVIKSGIYRDEIVKREKVIAFEMEGAGAWDYASIIIIKSVCDYADSHKNKSWQQYASVTAAACTKALLEQWRPSYALKILNHSGRSFPNFPNPCSNHDRSLILLFAIRRPNPVATKRPCWVKLSILFICSYQTQTAGG